MNLWDKRLYECSQQMQASELSSNKHEISFVDKRKNKQTRKKLIKETDNITIRRITSVIVSRLKKGKYIVFSNT